MTSARSLLRATAFALSLAGCTSPDVVATVGSSELLRGDLELYAKTQASRPLAESLDAVVTRQLLAEGARRKGVADQPEVAARLAASRREILAQALVDEAGRSIDEAQAKAHYEATKDKLATRRMQLAHIFFPLPAGATREVAERAWSNANTAWARLLGGDDFAKVAAELSEDDATKAKGGTLGEVREGQIATAIFEAASKLEAGAFSKPIATDFGLHILKAVSRAEKVTPPFDEVKGTLLAQLRREAEAKLVDQLSREISVKRFPEQLAPKPEAPK